MNFVCIQANLVIQENRLRVANNELSKAEAQLAEKQAEFDKVKAKCDAAMKEKQVCMNLKNMFIIAFELDIKFVDHLKYVFRTCWMMLRCVEIKCRLHLHLLMDLVEREFAG